ncbi:hypothetical protein [Thermocrinis sp.]|uniref:hypothetical protein n=1 Tax=Thermocrinis sp. TaxID=2024383 RepID=UPI003C7090B2
MTTDGENLLMAKTEIPSPLGGMETDTSRKLRDHRAGGISCSKPTAWDGDLIRASKLINLFISSKPTMWDGDKKLW